MASKGKKGSKAVDGIIKPPKPKTSGNCNDQISMNDEYSLFKAIIPRNSSQTCLLNCKRTIRIVKNDNEESKYKRILNKSNSFLKNQSRPFDITFKTDKKDKEEQNSLSLLKKITILPIPFPHNSKRIISNTVKATCEQAPMDKTASFGLNTYAPPIKRIRKEYSCYSLSITSKNLSHHPNYSLNKSTANTPKLMKRHPLLKNMFN